MGVLFMRKAVYRREETSGSRKLRNLNYIIYIVSGEYFANSDRQY
jgi:hypothetical protein